MSRRFRDATGEAFGVTGGWPARLGKVARTLDSGVSEAAERYAAAAFELAEAEGALDAVENDLKLFTEAMAASEDLRRAAASPLIAPEDKARGLVKVAEALGLSKLGRNLIGVAAHNRRAGDLEGIARAFRRRLAAHRGLREVEIVSAAPIEPKLLDELKAALTKALGVAVEPVTRVDERLIGGFVVRAGSRQYDASVRTQLDSLKLALKSA